MKAALQKTKRWYIARYFETEAKIKELEAGLAYHENNLRTWKDRIHQYDKDIKQTQEETSK